MRCNLLGYASRLIGLRFAHGFRTLQGGLQSTTRT